MRPLFVLAATAAALLTADASAQQNSQVPALTTENIVKPDAPARDGHLDVKLFANEPLTILRGENKLTGVIDGEEWSFADKKVTVKPDCGGRTQFPIEVTPDKRCTIGVTLAEMGRPGRYKVTLSLLGARGQPQHVALDFAVRRPLWCAVILVVAGLLTGFLVTAWRGGGRDRTKTVITIKEAVEALKDLDSGVGNGARMAPIIARGREMEAALLRGVPVEAAEVLELQARVRQYRFLLDIEMRGSSLPPDKRRELAAAIGTALDAMLPSASGGKLVTVPEDTLTAVRDKLRQLETEVEASAAGVAADQLVPPDAVPLPVTQQMTSRQARLILFLADWGVALILMLVFSAVALGTLYYGKPYWGGYGDMLAAFMVGFGAYAGSVASVDSFMQRARTP